MKDIKGYEGLYAVTSCGKVWSYRRGKFLNAKDNGYGYLFVILRKDGKNKAFKVHRLVAEAYLPNPYNLRDVSHKDECKTHNWLGNLEWTTHKDNCNMPLFKERISKVKTGVQFTEEHKRKISEAHKKNKE